MISATAQNSVSFVNDTKRVVRVVYLEQKLSLMEILIESKDKTTYLELQITVALRQSNSSGLKNWNISKVPQDSKV